MEESGKRIFDMSGISSRIYENEKDFQIIIDLLNKVRSPERVKDYPTKTDIEENFSSKSVRANTRIWFDGDNPIGWAYVDAFRNLRWELDSPYDETIGGEIVAWGETCIRKTLAKGGISTLDANCRESYTERISFLKRHGFHPTEDTSIGMIRDLSELISEPELPQGFTIRPIAGVDEAEAVASTHRAAFGTEYMTTENRLALMKSSEYDQSLDLVVIAPDKTIAAYCTCSVDEKEKSGETDPVAVHPQYQRLGLAHALLLKGMQLLKQRGIHSAHLVTSGDNISMQRTAKSVGFSLEYKKIWFSKEVI